MTDAQKAALAAAARDWSGANVPYVYGGTSRQGADCSGSVSAIFAAAGMPIGHMSSSGFAASGLFARSVGAPQIGDVGWYPGHVVIFGGNTAPGMDVWSASHTGGPVFGPAKSSWYGTPIWYHYVGP
jgi:cell wall-associated NlpC family hydrolase